jgi:hypothetical protein
VTGLTPRLIGMAVPDAMTAARTGTSVRAGTLALKEWGAVAHALLDGRQTVLLRKGGIHEKAFDAAVAQRDAFVLFPTVAHSHRERVRQEHHDVLALGEADVDEDAGTFVVRCGLTLVDAVPVARPDRLPDIADLHVWTHESVDRDRLAFRPRHPLCVLVVRAVELPTPVCLPRDERYAGCKSWVRLPLAWEGVGRQVHTEARLAADAARVHATVGSAAPRTAPRTDA